MERIGKYEVEGVLGRGGMGVVYLARDPDLDRHVALKVLQESLSSDESFLRRLEEEARAVAQLFHPNILPVNALSREGERLVIEMPYIETGSLADLIARHGLHCPDVPFYCADILEALSACHAHSMVHRDVKPGNVLLDAQGRALLSDFGLAKALGQQAAVPAGDMTATSVFVGTPRYAPLEAWDGAPPAPTWDLYSTGVILYEGLSGTRLVESDTFLAYVRAMEQKTFPSLSEVRQGISGEMSALVDRLLSPSPAARPADAEQALQMLRATREYQNDRRTLETTGRHAMPRPARMRTSGMPARRRLVQPVAVAVLACLLIAGALAVVLGNSFTETATPSPPAPPGTDAAETKESGLPALARLLSQPRFTPPKSARTFAVSVAGAPERAGLFVLVEGGEPGGAEALLFDELRLCSLQFEETGSDAIGVTGVWGAFSDATALECFHGEVTGTVRRLTDESSLWMALAFTARDHALRWEEHLTLTRTGQTDTALLWQVEESDYLASMLFRELAPRAPAWLGVANMWLPALPESRLLLHDGGGRAAPERSALWEKATAAGVPAFPREGGGKLAGLLGEAGVLLRLWAPAPEGWALRLGLQTGFAVPQRDSRRYEATCVEGTWVEGKTVAYGQPSDWAPTWQVAVQDEQEGWWVEVLLKMEGVPAPSEAEPWRLNAALLAPDTEGVQAPVLFWGAPATAETRHGVMLIGPAH